MEKINVWKWFCWKHKEFGKVPPNPLYNAKMCFSCYDELKIKSKLEVEKQINQKTKQ